MASQQLPPQTTLEERLRQLEEHLKKLTAAQVVNPVASFMERWLPGITLLTIIGFAYWLGNLSSTLNQTSDKVDKVYAQVLESKDSLSARTSVIEAKLDSIDKKISEQREADRRDAAGR